MGKKKKQEKAEKQKKRAKEEKQLKTEKKAGKNTKAGQSTKEERRIRTEQNTKSGKDTKEERQIKTGRQTESEQGTREELRIKKERQTKSEQSTREERQIKKERQIKAEQSTREERRAKAGPGPDGKVEMGTNTKPQRVQPELDEKRAAEILRAAGDESRMRILTLLQEKELCAGELLASLSIVQSTLSHHMKILTEAGIVECRKQGKRSYYRVDKETLAKAGRYLMKWSKEDGQN